MQDDLSKNGIVVRMMLSMDVFIENVIWDYSVNIGEFVYGLESGIITSDAWRFVQTARCWFDTSHQFYSHTHFETKVICSISKRVGHAVLVIGVR